MKPIKVFLTHQVLMELPFQSIKIIKGLYANTTITPKCHFLLWVTKNLSYLLPPEISY